MPKSRITQIIPYDRDNL